MELFRDNHMKQIIQTLLRIPASTREANQLAAYFTSVAEDLNSGLPRTNKAELGASNHPDTLRPLTRYGGAIITVIKSPTVVDFEYSRDRLCLFCAVLNSLNRLHPRSHGCLSLETRLRITNVDDVIPFCLNHG